MANKLTEGNKVLAYPLNLGADVVDDHGNPAQYMMFKIMDTERASKLKGDSGVGPVYVARRDGTGIETASKVQDWSRKQLNDYVGTGFATVEKDLDPVYNVKYDAVDRANEDWRLQKGMTRLDKVVILPMPNEHNVSTAVRYNDDYTPTILTKAGDIINALGDGVVSEGLTLAKNKLISTIVSKITQEDPDKVMKSMLAEERLAQNPRKEVMFEDIKFRQFSFRYQFAPKNAEESMTVNDIIQTFRYYALPEVASAKFFYMFPAEFNVSFILGQKDNPNIPKLTTCVLQRVGVNYSPNSSGWATLPNGAPVAIDMTLDFMEVELVDRSRIYDKKSAIRSGH